MKTFATTAALLLSLALGSASANELFVTSAKSAGGQAFALDINSSGTATALQIRVAVGEGLKVDLSKCVSGLPGTHSGACGYRNGKVTVLVHSETNEMLPSGMLSIGSIAVSGASAKELSVVELLAFDRNGNEVSISSDDQAPPTRSLAK
ncbi:MAG TPA: hypothetical protein PKZ76_07840 [Xanthomonadaceae bacterium]|nr:hypothetical protein [Xanthomonadaceae bacterium]